MATSAPSSSDSAWNTLVSLVTSSEAYGWTTFPRLKRPDEFAGGGDATVQTMLRASMLVWTQTPVHTSLLLPPSKRCARAFESLAVKLHKCILQLTGDASSKDSIAENLRFIDDALHASAVGEDAPPTDTVVEEYIVQLMKHLTGNSKIESEILAWKLMCAALTSVRISTLKIFHYTVRFVLDERTRLELSLRSGAESTYSALSPYINYALRVLELYQLHCTRVLQERPPPEVVLANLVFDPMLVDLLYPDGSTLLRHVPVKGTHTASQLCAVALWFAGLADDEVDLREDSWCIMQRAVSRAETDMLTGVDSRSVAESTDSQTHTQGAGTIVSHVVCTGDRVSTLRIIRGDRAASTCGAAADAADARSLASSVAKPSGSPIASAAGHGASRATEPPPEALLCTPSADVVLPVDYPLPAQQLILLRLHGVHMTEAAAELARCVAAGETAKVTITSLLSHARRHKLAHGAASRLISHAPLAVALRRKAYIHELTPPAYSVAPALEQELVSEKDLALQTTAATSQGSFLRTLKFRGKHLELVLDDSRVDVDDKGAFRDAIARAATAVAAPADTATATTPSASSANKSMRSLGMLARATSAWKLSGSGATTPSAASSTTVETAAPPTEPAAVPPRPRQLVHSRRTEGSPLHAYSLRERALMLSQLVADLQNCVMAFPLPTVQPAHDPQDWSDALDAVLIKVLGSSGAPARDALVALLTLFAAGRADVLDALLRGENDLLDELAPTWYDESGCDSLQSQVLAVLRLTGVRERLLRAGRSAIARESWLYDVVLSAVHRSPVFCCHRFLVDMFAEVRWPTATESAADVDLAAQTVCNNAIKYGIQHAAQAFAHDGRGMTPQRSIVVGGRTIMLPPPSPHTGGYGGGAPQRVLLCISGWGVSIADVRADAGEAPLDVEGRREKVPLSLRYSVPFSHTRWYVEDEGALVLEIYEAYKPGQQMEIRSNADLPLLTLVLCPSIMSHKAPRHKASDLAVVLTEVYDAWKAQAPQCHVRMLPDPTPASELSASVDPLDSTGAHVLVPWRPSFRSGRGAAIGSLPAFDPNNMLTTPARMSLSFAGLGLKLGVDGQAAPGATVATKVPATSSAQGLPSTPSQSSAWFSSRRLDAVSPSSRNVTSARRP